MTKLKADTVDHAEEVAASFQDYASVTLVVDHLMTDPRDDGHSNAKVIYSTQTATESLVAQLAYFGLSEQVGRPGVISLLAKAQEKAAVLVLDVPPHGQHMGQIQIIVDAAFWTDEALFSKINPTGSVLGFHAALLALAYDLKKTSLDQAGGDIIHAFLTE